MLVILCTITLAAYSIYKAWQYSKLDVDPDWSMFNLAAFAGSWYGRDFVDCKSPSIHIWYWLIAKIVGVQIRKVVFTHHLIIGCFGSLLIYAVSGNFWIALVYLVLVTSGFLLTFHGNVGQQPALFITLALVVDNPWIAMLLWWAALAFEPKLVLAYLVWLIGRFDQAIATVIVGGFGFLSVVMLYNNIVMRWLIEANLTIPGRMRKARVTIWKAVIDSVLIGQGLVYILPWVYFAVFAQPDWLYWLQPAMYIGLIYYGIAVRPNHLIPLIPWIAASGIQPIPTLCLAVIDFVASYGFLGNIWGRFYNALGPMNYEARKVGEWLRHKDGTVYVNDLHSGVYVWARKPVQYGLAAQIEIREVAKERVENMLQLWKDKPADWVVVGPFKFFEFAPKGYDLAAQTGNYKVYKRR